MPNYQNGKIYAIKCKETDKMYIGSTTQTLGKRFSGHKKELHCSSREILCFDNAYIELIENYPCESRKELVKKEGEYIRLYFDKAVNKNKAGSYLTLTREEYFKEYYKQNKEKKIKEYREQKRKEIKNQRKQHYEQNKEQINIQRKEKMICECGSVFRISDKSIHYKTIKHTNFVKKIDV